MNKVASSVEQSFTEKIDNLLKLQEVVQSLDELRQGIESLKKEAALEERKYQSKRLQYEKFSPYVKKAEDNFKATQRSVEDINEKIKKCEEKKKKIKTVREFKALNREIKDLEQQNIEVENELLKKSEELENKRERLALIGEDLEGKKTAYNEKRDEFNAFEKEHNEEIKKCSAKKQKLEKKIAPKLLTLFYRIYGNKRGSSIVAAELSGTNAVCQGCYTILPKQNLINLKKQIELNFCSFCSRILYWSEEE